MSKAASKGFRIEHDSMGELQVPADALWGAQTQRAVQNFPVSGQRMPRGFIRALGLVKGAAAGVNAELGHLPKNVAKAIQTAAAEVAAGNWDAQFPIDVYQTGSGTSSNMNANEVIATLANRAGKAGKTTVHPNDHVNQGQSSNDVIPTALRVSAVLATHEQLLPALVHLRKTLDKKGRSLRKVVKTGRTHLMDAMPLTFEQEFGAWSAQLASAQERIEDSLKRVRRLPLGGTAIGTGINADPRFGAQVAKALKQQTGFKFDSAENKFEGLAAQDDAVELSGQLNALAVALIKIANDLRWMNAGPLAGLGEIELPALQPGSSIMPELFLDEVLHRLDVMVGGALDLLHARGLGRAEAGRQLAQAGDGGVGERRQFDDARFGGQRQQPFHLDHDAGLDQAVFGEDRAQGVDLAGVAAIERGQGEQGGIGHVGRAGTSGGGHILRRAGQLVPAAGRQAMAA